MKEPYRSEVLRLFAVSLLAALALFLVWDHQRDDAPTMDEVYHLFSGAEYVENGTYWLNPEHPPLAKDMAGLALQPLRLVPPAGGRSRDASPHKGFLSFIYRNRVDADRIVAAGRRPFPWLHVVLVFVVYSVARRLWNGPAALLAAGLIALDPNFIAHAGVVHDDVGATLTMLVAIALALRAARGKTLVPWLMAGLALGVALAIKFTAVILLPLFLLAPFLRWERGTASQKWSELRDGFVGAGAACALSLLVVTSIYAVNMRNMPDENAAAIEKEYLAERGASPEVIRNYARLSRISPSFGHFMAGLKGVSLYSQNGRQAANYLCGRVSAGGFKSYFFIAFLIKSTPAFLLMTLSLLVFGGRELLSRRALGLLIPAALLFLVSVFSRFNIGVRHILPIYPLLAITGAGILSTRLRPRPFALAALLLIGSAGASLASIHPYEFGYFNAIAGGPAGGEAWLTDSNIDWGQDMKRLGNVLRAEGTESETTLVGFSALASNYYSPRARTLQPGVPIAPGRYAVSALMQAIGPEFMTVLEGPESGAQIRKLLELLKSRGRKLRRVGASITIWELPRLPALPANAPSTS